MNNIVTGNGVYLTTLYNLPASLDSDAFHVITTSLPPTPGVAETESTAAATK